MGRVMTDRIEQATRIMVATCGRERAYIAGEGKLALLGYTVDEIKEAIRLWRVWKRGMRELDGRHDG